MTMNRQLFENHIGVIILTLCLSLLSSSFGEEKKTVTLRGEAGTAENHISDRLDTYPFTSLAWLRADLTGEKVSNSDNNWKSKHNRPFKNFSGDISGRYIEIMSIAGRKSSEMPALLRDLIDEALKNQRKGGYFCASGEVDWNKALDKKLGPKTFHPALWGNARMLCGLIEAYRSYKDPAVLSALKKLGDFYVTTVPMFADPSRKSEYVRPGEYFSNYVICYFPAMEGLVKLHLLTGEKKYLDTAVTMAKFFEQFDRLPIDHTHGMLCNHVGILLLYKTLKDQYYLDRAETRWRELVEGGYIQAPGGPLEKCHTFYKRDEGCALTDWFRLNLELAEITGKSKYWAMAERVFHNHFLQNQALEGGHGHRSMIGDKAGLIGFGSKITESTWCCIYHGKLAFPILEEFLCTHNKNTLTCNFSLDYTYSTDDYKIVSTILPAINESEIHRQHIQIVRGGQKHIRVRIPHWASSVSAVDAEGQPLSTSLQDSFCSVTKNTTDATFIYTGGVFAEDRRCVRLPKGSAPENPYTLWYGPKLLVKEGNPPPSPTWPLNIKDLKKLGFVPLSSETRSKTVYFVISNKNDY